MKNMQLRQAVTSFLLDRRFPTIPSRSSRVFNALCSIRLSYSKSEKQNSRSRPVPAFFSGQRSDLSRFRKMFQSSFRFRNQFRRYSEHRLFECELQATFHQFRFLLVIKFNVSQLKISRVNFTPCPRPRFVSTDFKIQNMQMQFIISGTVMINKYGSRELCEDEEN